MADDNELETRSKFSSVSGNKPVSANTFKKQLNTLQVARGVAALAVVLYHINATFALPKYFNSQVSAVLSTGHAGVELFFVLSGFLMLLTNRSSKATGGAVLFLKKRLIRIYPPLWFAIAISIVGFAIVGEDLSSELNVVTLFSAIFALPFSGEEPILTVEWTLRREVLFYLLFAVFVWKRQVGACLLSIWFLLSAASIFLESVFIPRAIFEASNLIFGVGMLTAAFGLLEKKRFAKPILALGILMFMVFIALESLGAVANQVLLVFAYGVSSGLTIYGLSILEWRDAIKRFPSTLLYLGNASYSIYLVHFLLVSLFTKLAVRLNLHLPLPLIVWFVLVLGFTLVGSLIFYTICEKPLVSQRKKPIKQAKLENELVRS